MTSRRKPTLPAHEDAELKLLEEILEELKILAANLQPASDSPGSKQSSSLPGDLMNLATSVFDDEEGSFAKAGTDLLKSLPGHAMDLLPELLALL